MIFVTCLTSDYYYYVYLLVRSNVINTMLHTLLAVLIDANYI